MLWLTIGTFLFYSLNVTGFKIGKFILVRSCIKDEPIDLAFWVPYLAFVITFYYRPDIGKWLLISFYFIGFTILSINTYRFTIWPNERKIKGYNKCFEKTHHIIPASEKRLIPDTFHIILYVLLLINLIVMFIFIVK